MISPPPRRLPALRPLTNMADDVETRHQYGLPLRRQLMQQCLLVV